MSNEYFNKIMSIIIFISLAVLSFFLLKPILMSIIVGFILAFIFTPIYNFLFKYTNSKNFSAGLLCFLLIIIVVIPFWFLFPIIVQQAFKVYLVSQELDFVTPLKSIFPSLFASEQLSSEIGSILFSFTTRITNSFVNSLSKIILNFPSIMLQFFVAFFTFFFVLKEKEKIISYIQSILPFSKDVEVKLFESSRAITGSVIYGQIIVGILQGIVLGIGLFIFNSPNALLLTLLACLVGVLPIIGTSIVYIPVTIYFFMAGNTIPAFGVLIFGFISNLIEQLMRPLFVSKRAKVPSLLILIGMIGGWFLLGIMGFVLGQLILAYLLIILDVYRTKPA